MASPIYFSGKTVKKKHKNDLWQTPPEIAKQCTDILVDLYLSKIEQSVLLDAGANSGVFGNALHLSCVEHKIQFPDLIGVEIDDVPINPYYNSWHNKTDYLDFNFPTGKRVDIVFGNPPFSLFEEFYEHTVNNIIRFNKGIISWILPLNYLQGDKRYDKIFSNKHLEYVFTFKKRIKWTGGSPFDQHSLFIWNNAYEEVHYKGSWII